VDAGTADVRRITGTLASADEAGCTVTGPDVPDGELRIAYDQIERARTVFEWGPESRKTKNERVKRP
jgi:ribosome maturation factor RimP